MDHSENVAFLMLIMSVVLQTYYPSLAFPKNTVFDALEKGKKTGNQKISEMQQSPQTGQQAL